MKKSLTIIFVLIFLISCRVETKNLKIVLTKNEKTDSIPIKFDCLWLIKSDSVFYKTNNLRQFNFQDTIVINNLPIGEYQLKYVDVIGNLISKPIDLKKTTEIIIVSDSIDIRRFENKTPIINLKKGGCGPASCYRLYKISRIENNYYCETGYLKKRELKPSEIKAFQKFESELMAIREKKFPLTLGPSKTYEIITDKSELTFGGNHNWNGWSNLFQKLNKNSN